MADDAESLIARLRSECVRVIGRQPGCGFAVAPGWLITCAHVVGREAPLGYDFEVRPWQVAPRMAVLRHLAGDADLALLADPGADRTTAVFGSDPQRDELLVGIGFPVREQQPELDDFTAHFEGITKTLDTATGRQLRLMKLKQGQIEYGFSGGPLIHTGSGRVVGVTRLSQDTRLDLGGWAVPADTVRVFCQNAGVELAPPEALQPVGGEVPARPPVERMRDLLLALPSWNSQKPRRSFVERALGRRHRVLDHVELEGDAAQVAWDVAKACEDYPEPTQSGLLPACALLAAIPREFGQSQARDVEIRELGALLACSKPTPPWSPTVEPPPFPGPYKDPQLIPIENPAPSSLSKSGPELPSEVFSGDPRRDRLFRPLLDFSVARDIVFAFGGTNSGLLPFRRQFEDFLDHNGYACYPKVDFNLSVFKAISTAREREISVLPDYAKYSARMYLNLKCLFAALAYSACSVLHRDYPGKLDHLIKSEFLISPEVFKFHYFSRTEMIGTDLVPIVRLFFTTLQEYAEAVSAPNVLVFMPLAELSSWLWISKTDTVEEVWPSLQAFTATLAPRSSRARGMGTTDTGNVGTRSAFDRVSLIVLCDQGPLGHEASTRLLLSRTIWPIPPLCVQEVAQLLLTAFPKIAKSDTAVEDIVAATGGAPWFVSLLLSFVAQIQSTVRRREGGRNMVALAVQSAEALLLSPQTSPNSECGRLVVDYLAAARRRLMGPDTRVDEVVRKAWCGSKKDVSTGVEASSPRVSPRVESWLATGLMWIDGDPLDTDAPDYAFRGFPWIRLRRAGRLQEAFYETLTCWDHVTSAAE
ncbi:MAG: serine protease [Arenicellales bacterium]